MKWILCVAVLLVGCVPATRKVSASYVLGVSHSARPGDPMITLGAVQTAATGTTAALAIASGGTNSTPSSSSWMKEIVYAGHDGTAVFLLYREYKNNLIRDGYRQEFVFDLAENQTLILGPWEIKIEEATNTKILFTVVSDQGVSQAPIESAKPSGKKTSGGPRPH